MNYFVLAGDLGTYQDLILYLFEDPDEARQFIEAKDFEYYRVILGEELDIVHSVTFKEKETNVQ